MSHFEVQFHDPAIWSLTAQAAGPRKWIGAASLSVAGPQLQLAGFRHRLFRPKIPQTVTWPLNEICNVTVTGRQVQLLHTDSDGQTEDLKFWARSDDDAAAIGAALPSTQTAEHKRKAADADAFARLVETLPPRRYLTEALVALNVLAFAWTVYRGGGLILSNGQAMISLGSNYAPATLEGQWWRLFTAVFLHFGIFHLLLNMAALWSAGILAERLFGSPRFALLYLFAGLTGNIASIGWNPQVNGAGASGAIFGVIGGLLAFMIDPETRIPHSVSRQQLKFLLLFVFYNLVNGVTHRGIDNAAHLGGLLGGFVMGWVLARPLSREAREPGAHPVSLGAAVLLAIAVLDVWIRHAIHPLTAEERSFERMVAAVVRDDSRLEPRARQLRAAVESGTTAKAAGARELESTFVTAWQEDRDRLRDAALSPTSKLLPLRKALVDYLGGESLGYDLLAESYDDNDASKQQWAEEVLERGVARRRLVFDLLPPALLPPR